MTSSEGLVLLVVVLCIFGGVFVYMIQEPKQKKVRMFAQCDCHVTRSYVGSDILAVRLCELHAHDVRVQDVLMDLVNVVLVVMEEDAKDG